MNVALVGSECAAMYYWYNGSNWVWVAVTGKITKGSSYDFNQGRKLAHINSEVIFQTPDGAKKCRVAESCGTVLTENGKAAIIGNKVIGTGFKDGRITGNCSAEVMAT